MTNVSISIAIEIIQQESITTGKMPNNTLPTQWMVELLCFAAFSACK